MTKTASLPIGNGVCAPCIGGSPLRHGLGNPAVMGVAGHQRLRKPQNVGFVPVDILGCQAYLAAYIGLTGESTPPLKMLQTEIPASPIPDLRTVELTAGLESKLQRFFEENPEYFEAVLGAPARPSEAQEEIDGELPAGCSFTRKLLIGYVDASDSLVAMATVISDFPAPTVWHISLFIVATLRHGTGAAQTLYRGLETWAASNGATWLRLGVVQGHVRAERFWQSLGYVQVRAHSGVEMGKLKNTVRVMVKPLRSDSLEHYLSFVERDRPGPESAH